MKKLLEIQNLHVSLTSSSGLVHAVRGINLQVNQGEIVGLVGESGCGKSVTAQMILRLLPNCQTSGEIWLDEENILLKKERDMECIRGKKCGMIFQDPLSALNPIRTIGFQMMEGMLKHEQISKEEARKRAIQILDQVGLTHPKQRLSQYPFELSGGMRQRVVIAISIACYPLLLIADEPTTALDKSTQMQVVGLLKEIQEQRGMGILFITHDLPLARSICHRLLVMYAGKIVEEGLVEEIFSNPQHPYTQALLRAIPSKEKKQGLLPIIGNPPNLLRPPVGCAFHPRCPQAMPICTMEEPDKGNPGTTCWLHHPLAKKENQK